jgi:hypothetical protein
MSPSEIIDMFTLVCVIVTSIANLHFYVINRKFIKMISTTTKEHGDLIVSLAEVDLDLLVAMKHMLEENKKSKIIQTQ